MLVLSKEIMWNTKWELPHRGSWERGLPVHFVKVPKSGTEPFCALLKWGLSRDCKTRTPHYFSLSLQVTLKIGGAQVRRQVGSADSVFYLGTGALLYFSPIPLLPFLHLTHAFPSRSWTGLCSWARELWASCAQGLWGTHELIQPGLRELGPRPRWGCRWLQPEPSR